MAREAQDITKASLAMPTDLYDQIVELGRRHDRNFSAETRQAMRHWIAAHEDEDDDQKGAA